MEPWALYGKKGKPLLPLTGAEAAPGSIRSSLMANYLDYDEMFRNREDYQATLGTRLSI